MGTWEVHAFGNDTACDWGDLVWRTDDLKIVESKLDEVISHNVGPVPARISEEGLAACEIIARAIGRRDAGNQYTPVIDSWLSNLLMSPPASAVKKAISVVNKILSDSELSDSWKDDGDWDAWKLEVDKLLTRLSA